VENYVLIGLFLLYLMYLMIIFLKQKFAELLYGFLPERELLELQNMIEIPPENIPGDFAFPCFTLAKDLRKAPNVIA
jgi:arginyl-tRNA synthetase